MKIINKYILLTGIFIITKLAMGQPSGNGGSTNVPSPNAASMGTFTNIPVSYYTGTPNIDIPIGNVNQGILSTSVSINYHPGNLVVGTPSSSIGKGWSLNAGGVISRIVQDKPDDVKDTGYFFLDEFDFDDGKDHTSKFHVKDLEPDIYSFSVGELSGKFYFDPSSSNAKTIPKSDIIITPILDISSTTQQPGGPRPSGSYSGTGNLKGFVLTNTDGTKYFFGTYDNREAIEKTTLESYKYKYTANGDIIQDGTDLIRQTVASSWYLLKVMDHNGDHAISYYYDKEYYSYKTLADNQIEFKNYDREKSIIEDNRNINGIMRGEPTSRNVLSSNVTLNAGFTSDRPYYGKFHNYRSNLVEGVKLTSIESEFELIEFIYQTPREDLQRWGTHPLPNRLDTIILRSNDHNVTVPFGSTVVCKKIAFDYEYFEDKKLQLASGSGTLRPADLKTLFLKSIYQSSCDNTIKDNPYEFTYFAPDTADGIPFFPTRLNKAIDHFGYYNGADGSYNSSINNNEKEFNIPYTSVSVWDKKNNRYITKSKGNAEREPKEIFSQYGVLSQIVYPTGGSANYQYENHRYNFDVIGSYDNKIHFEGCSFASGNCCQLFQQNDDYTFTTLNEIEHSYYSFNLTVGDDVIYDDVPNENPMTPCGSDNVRRARMKLVVREKNTNVQVHVKEINIEGSQHFNEKFNLPVAEYDYTNNSYIGDGLKPNVTYTFDVEFYGGEGIFELVVPFVTIEPNKLGCGLRVKSTRISDGMEETPNDIIKDYNYNIGNSNISSGIQFSQPQYGVSVEHYDFIQIKKGTNDFVTYKGNQYHEVPGGNVYFQRILFSENSLLPLFGFDGIHIGYQEVKETTRPTNGVIAYKFKAKRNREYELIRNFPTVPHQIDLENGQMTKTEIKDNNDNVLSETSYKAWEYPLQHIERSKDIIKLYEINSFPKSAIFTSYDINLLVFNKYNINRAYYQIEEITTTVEGVSITTEYEYDQINPHKAPRAVTKTNSDGSKIREEFYYAFDISPLPYFDIYFRRNLLNVPIKTENYVLKNGTKTLISGSQVEHGLYNNQGNPVNPTSLREFDGKLYPYVNHAFKGIANVEDDYRGTWQPVDSVLKYNEFGDIIESRVVGMEKRYKTYSKGLVESSKYLNQVSYFKYYTGTRLLKTSIAKDGSKMEYQYDQYGRLTDNFSFGNNIHNRIEYHSGDLKNKDYTYIKQSTQYAPANNSPVIQSSSIIYFDGLGRELSKIAVNAGTNGKDQSSLNYFDSLGRAYKVVTFEGGNNGTFLWSPPNLSTTRTALTKYDKTPLNRVIEVTDKDWFPIYSTYGANTSQDAVVDWENGGFYAANTLAKSVSINSAGNKTITFTDKFGQQILARKANSNETKRNDTYYLYDLKGRVSKVLPPATNLTQDDLIFTYTYDGLNNKIAFKDPGKQEAILVYDKLGNTVAVQDAVLKSQGKWMIYEFDEYQRNTRTGTINAQGNTKPNPETVIATEVWTDTYYGSTGIETDRILSKTVGIFDGFTLLPNKISYSYEYDQYGRAKRNTQTNHLGGITEIDQFKYDFAGNVLSARTIHQKDVSSSPIIIINSFDIDNQGRHINEYQSINGRTEHLSHITYDDFGRISQSQLGVRGSSALQTVDFSYDQPGHLIGINANPTSQDLFSLQIGYNDNLGVRNANTYTDGKIGTVRWKHKGSNWQNYTYQYDYLGQLLKAKYSEDNGTIKVGDYDGDYTYDERGNFLTVKRNGVYKKSTGAYASTVIDNLTYTYYNNSNKLKRVHDASMPIIGNNDTSQLGNNQRGNRGGGNSPLGSGVDLLGQVQMKGYNPIVRNGNYEYNNDGNTTYDPSRDIDLYYNYFSLPYKIEPRDKSKTLQMLYDAEGNLLQKKLVENGNVVSKTDYIEEFHYKNGEQILLTSNGLVKNITTIPVYNYHINDYLGNTRVVFSDRNADGLIDTSEVLQLNNFYPYGMSMYGSWTNNVNALQPAENHFLYNGMERIHDLDLGLDFAIFRTYDPTIGRWFQNDPNSTIISNFSPYNAMVNNPVTFEDKDGDLPPLLVAAAIAVVSGTISGVQSMKAGNSFISGFARAAAISLFSSGMSFGIGETFTNVTGSLVAKEVARAAAHGVVGGAISMIQGGSFGSGFASGAVSSLVGSATTGWNSFGGQLASAGISGGLSSLAAGGNFFSGAIQGITIQALNHQLHKMGNDPGKKTLLSGDIEVGLPISGYGKDSKGHRKDPVKGKLYLKQAIAADGTAITTVELMLNDPNPASGLYYEIKMIGTFEVNGSGYTITAGGEFEGGFKVPGTTELMGGAAYVKGSATFTYSSKTNRTKLIVNDVFVGSKVWIGTLEIKGEFNLSEFGRRMYYNAKESGKIVNREIVNKFNWRTWFNFSYGHSRF